jgi:hypothetical protein
MSGHHQPMPPGAWALRVVVPLADDVRLAAALARECNDRGRQAHVLATLAYDPSEKLRLAEEAHGWATEGLDHLRTARMLTAYMEGVTAQAELAGPPA